MSRHRNVRNMNYDDEYDGYDDVYGRSVEDDHYCVSPTAAEFMYDRSSKTHSMSAFMAAHGGIAEEELEREPRKVPPQWQQFQSQDPIEQAKMTSCLQEIRGIVGNSIAEPALIEAIVKNNFDLERSLDAVLNLQGTDTDKDITRPDKEKRDKDTTKVYAGGNETCGLTSEAGGASHVGRTSNGDVATRSYPSSKPPTIGFFSTPEPVGSKRDKENEKKDLDTKGKVADTAEESLKQLTLASVTPTNKLTPRGKEVPSRLDPCEEYKKLRGDCKSSLNMVVIGHVDAGKSTLMGHLLFLVGAVNKKTMHKYEQESKKIGKASFMFAWVLDETGEERSRGVTMDVGYSKFETASKLVTLLDAPGHKDFIPNMITGAAQADVAVLVVDATRGEFETGFEAGGQTREHALLVRSLGVAQIIVAVNKLDTVNWSQDRYKEIVTKLSLFLRQAGYKDDDVNFVPCSGLTGENLTESPKEEALMKWYSGPNLLQRVDNFRSPDRPVDKPFRLSICDVFKGQGTSFCVSGKMETGCIRNGDKVAIMPLGEVAQVKGILTDEISVPSAFAGDQVTVTLSGVDMANVTVGCVLCDSVNPIKVCTRFQARIVMFNVDVPVTKGFPVVIHYQSLSEPGVIKRLISQLHKTTGEVIKKKPRCLGKHANAIIELECSRPLCLEVYKDIKELGRFMLRSGGSTIAAGLVTEILS